MRMCSYQGYFYWSSITISVCEDPDDDKFIECAIAGQCKIIISGDKPLLKFTGYEDIVILNPRNFDGLVKSLNSMSFRAKREILSI